MKKRRYGPRQQVHLRNMSSNVVRIFKGYCYNRGVPMNAAIEYLMREAVRQERRVSKQQITPRVRRSNNDV